MDDSGSHASGPAIVRRVPGALGLPSADPRAIAVETMLRMAQTRYTKANAHYRDLALSVPKAQSEAGAAKGRQYATANGVQAVVKSVSSALDAEVLGNDQRPVAACVEALAVNCLFPAFIFLTLYDYSLYQHGIKKSVVPKVATMMESLRGTFRANALRENPYFYGDANRGGAPPTSAAASLVQVGVMKAVLEEVSEALKSLELLHVAHAGADETFFLGTARPCSVDAYAYAAISSFVHADFASFGAAGSAAGVPGGRSPDGMVLSPVMDAFQKRIREECPFLVKYAEKVRGLLFEDCSRTYNLKPSALSEAIERSVEHQSVEELYAKGRLKTLMWTGLFACCYFVVANADILAAVVEGLADALEEDEEEGVAGGAAEEGADANQSH